MTSDHVSNVLWFDEVTKDDVNLVGGKGANLGEMTQAKIPVPNGFIVTAQAYFRFIKETGLDRKIEVLLTGLEVDDSQKLQKVSDKIMALILSSSMPESVASDVKKAYRKLGEGDVAVRSSATAEDLPDASFAGQQSTYLNIFGVDKVIEAVRACWASLFESRAIFYRVQQHFDHMKVGIAVPVQTMVESEISGIMFTVEPVTSNQSTILIEAVYGLGEAIVSGSLTPDQYTVNKADFTIQKRVVVNQPWQLIKRKTNQTGGQDANEKVDVAKDKAEVQKLSDDLIVELARIGKQLEDHYHHAQDIEWGISKNTVYILQTRAVTTIPVDQDEQTTEFVQTGLDDLKILAQGSPASPGVRTGKVNVIHSPDENHKIKQGDILVTEMTTPDYVPAMRRAGAIVTDQGGRTCHAAIVSRELGLPCVVGTETATKNIKSGEVVTVDGSTGKVYAGDVSGRLEYKVVKKVSSRGAHTKTRTKVYVNLGEPQLAEAVAKRDVDGVGLLRAEFMIANIGKHPRAMIDAGKSSEFTDAIYNDLMTFASAFDPRPVIYRATDFKTNEYRKLEGGEKYEGEENNPMIGFRGALRYIKDPEVFKLEMEAVKRVREKHKNLWVMLPFVRTPSELLQSKQIMIDMGLYRDADFKLFMMVEIPSNVIILERFIGVGIDGVSIGSNDLTQLILGIDRDNSKVEIEFDERNEAVLWALERTIRVARQHGIMASICGQAPTDYPELTKKLVEWGITSVSVSPDMIEKTREVVQKTEAEVLN